MTSLPRNEKAAAEIVGSLVLISIFVLAFAILAMVLFSLPAPQKIPAVALSITNQSKIIKISHESGDSIPMSDVEVLVDGVLHAFTCPDCGDSWSIGETLTIDSSDHTDFPNKVDIVFSGSGTARQLLTSMYLGTMTPTQTPVIIPTTPSVTHIITASAGAGGSISPSGSVTIPDGSSQTFTISQNPLYSILDVVVDGVSQGPTPSYTFTNVHEDHTISATFAINTYTITASAGANGSVTPAGVTTVNYGATPTYAITPNPGYHVADVLVNGTSVGAVTGYVFPSVMTNMTISATFAINTYTITASAGANGAVTPAGVTTVDYGATPTYAITPNPGYQVMNVLVNGTSVGAVTSYVFPSVTTNMAISATFKLPAPTVISITPGSGIRGTTVPITNLAGTNFVIGTTPTVQLIGPQTVTASNVVVSSPTKITCVFVIGGGNNFVGTYNVVVTNTDGQSGTLTSGFTVTKT